jgi:hypothetical protein
MCLSKIQLNKKEGSGLDMEKEDKPPWFTIFCVFGFGLSFVLNMAQYDTYKRIKKTAIEMGAAEYHPKTGQFIWIRK